MKKVGSVFGLLLFAAVMAFSLSGWVKGYVFGFVWQHFGDDTFICGGDQVVTISGKTLEMDGTIVSAGGNCHITLKDCHFKGTETISIGGDAVLTVEGGTIEGTEVAIQVYGAGFEIYDATVKGGTTGLVFNGNTGTSSRVERTTIEGLTAFSARNKAKITFVDSTISGRKVAVSATRGITVDLGNSTIIGKMKVGKDATVVP